MAILQLASAGPAPVFSLPPKRSSEKWHKQKQCRFTRRSLRNLASTEEGRPPKPTGGIRRPVVVLPGLGNSTADYGALKLELQQRGLACVVADVARTDWLRNAAGLLDVAYWRGTLKPRPVLDWYLSRVGKAIEAARALAAAAPSSGVSVIGHSAGGWLARLFMAEFGVSNIELLLTLGTPHLPPPRGVPGVIDQTRGLLYHIEEAAPGAYHAPDVAYVCVSGRYIKGQRLFAREVASEGSPLSAVESAAAEAAAAALSVPPVRAAASRQASPAAAPDSEDGEGALRDGPASGGATPGAPPSLQARIIGQGYKQVCGYSEVWGDGVVPEPSALLPGAKHIVVDGVYHSPVGASEFRPWYGSPSVLPLWIDHL